MMLESSRLLQRLAVAAMRGDLTVAVGRLTLTGGAQISSSVNAGRIGTLTVTATDAILLAGRDSTRGLPSGLFNPDVGGSPTPGRVVIHTPTLRLEERALIGGTPAALDLVVTPTPSGGELVTFRQGASAAPGLGLFSEARGQGRGATSSSRRGRSGSPRGRRSRRRVPGRAMPGGSRSRPGRASGATTAR